MRQIGILCMGMMFLSHCTFPPPTTSDDQVRTDPSTSSSSRYSRADQNAKLDTLQEHVDKLEGKLEVLSYEISELREKNQSSFQDFDARLSVLEGDINTQSSTQAPSISTAEIAKNVAQTHTKPSSGKDDIDTWIEQAENGKALNQTLPRLDQWIAQHPDDPKTKQAKFALAKGYFEQGDYPRAIQSFQTVVDEHPQSDQSCRARYHQGLAFIKLQDPKNAQLFFEETIALCPKHEAKNKSQEQINKLSS